MRHYLDHAATSPLRPSALHAMTSAWSQIGNPSSQHTSGRAAHALLEDAREQLAEAVDAHPSEVIFTGGGTEADNMVVLGGATAGRSGGRPQVAVSAVEHPAVLAAAHALGAAAHILHVDTTGRVTEPSLAGLAPNTAWVSVMWVNNETGTIQPLASVVEAARRVGASVHSDAVQALPHLNVSFADSGLDAMTISAHKLGGPVGVGALIARRDAPLAPVSRGGEQERRLRSGTVPVALAAGFAAAAAETVAHRADESQRLAVLRARLVAGLEALPRVHVNGGEAVGPAIVNATFEGTRADDLLLMLDAAGVDASTGSACTAGVHQPSEVLLAMGCSEAEASASLRFSLGWTSTDADVDAVLALLPDALVRARAAAKR